MTDTRPALTARWRELERRGWKFCLGNRTISCYGDTLLDRVVLEAYHANDTRMWDYVVFLPMSEQAENLICMHYEGLTHD